MSKNEIVFIHIPRTGGGSFIRLLLEWYHPDFHKFTGTLEHSPNLKKRVNAGHFPADRKYLDAYLCTFMRDPVEWTISRWHYGNLIGREYFSDPIEFMDKTKKTNRQSHFLNDIKPNEFDFIGITDYYEESIELFKCTAPPSNIRVWNNHRRNAAPRDFEIKQEWIEEIRKRNSIDIKLYKQAKKYFRYLCQENLKNEKDCDC